MFFPETWSTKGTKGRKEDNEGGGLLIRGNSVLQMQGRIRETRANLSFKRCEADQARSSFAGCSRIPTGFRLSAQGWTRRSRAYPGSTSLYLKPRSGYVRIFRLADLVSGSEKSERISEESDLLDHAPPSDIKEHRSHPSSCDCHHSAIVGDRRSKQANGSRKPKGEHPGVRLQVHDPTRHLAAQPVVQHERRDRCTNPDQIVHVLEERIARNPECNKYRGPQHPCGDHRQPNRADRVSGGRPAANRTHLFWRTDCRDSVQPFFGLRWPEIVPAVTMPPHLPGLRRMALWANLRVHREGALTG